MNVKNTGPATANNPTEAPSYNVESDNKIADITCNITATVVPNFKVLFSNIAPNL